MYLDPECVARGLIGLRIYMARFLPSSEDNFHQPFFHGSISFPEGWREVLEREPNLILKPVAPADRNRAGVTGNCSCAKQAIPLSIPGEGGPCCFLMPSLISVFNFFPFLLHASYMGKGNWYLCILNMSQTLAQWFGSLCTYCLFFFFFLSRKDVESDHHWLKSHHW